MNRTHVLIAVILLSTFIFTKDDAPQKTSDTSFDEAIHTWSRSLAEVFHLVNTKSYYPVKVEESMIKLLDAFVHQDDHSHFLGPKDYKNLIKVTTGNFFGLGIVLGPKRQEDDHLLVLDVLPGKPAHKAGLQRFDKIMAIDGQAVSTLSVEDAISKLKSEKRYSTVNLDVMRDKKGAFSVSAQRDLIEEEHANAYYLPKQGIMYCSLSVFSQQTAEQMEGIIKKALEKKPKGIILDLRDNSGGILQSAAHCAGLFLKKGSLVASTKDRTQKVIETYSTTRQPIVKQDIPLFILVNEYTASAAEILSKALSDHAKTASKTHAITPYVFTLGITTYGKGSVQEVIPMSNDCALKLTTFLYYLPDNTCIQSKGMVPDFIVEQKYPPTPEMKLLAKLYGKEKGTKKEETDESKKDWKKEKQEAFKNDYQVQTAIHLISLLNLGLKNYPQQVNTREKALDWLKSNYCTAQTMEIEDLK